VDAAFNFANVQGLAGLRREAVADSPEAKRAVAQQFEALFLNVLLKQMRESSASLNAGLFDDDQRAQYESMFDQQLALSLSQGRGLGLADSIVRFLGGLGADGTAQGAVGAGFGVGGPTAESRALVSPSHTPQGAQVPQVPQVPQGAQGAQMPHGPHEPHEALPGSPDEFVSAIWPHAERAARSLGVGPEVLVAQAALETGWGRHMIRDGAGRPAFNLFGIKAGADWGGARVNVSTLEFTGGVPERRREPFRAYGSIAASFDDYVDFLKSRSRYAEALDAGTPEGYLRGLQAAGYATDPRYADKILAILGDQLARTSADNAFNTGVDAGVGGDKS
jgi:flagellar protein FlgJ